MTTVVTAPDAEADPRLGTSISDNLTLRAVLGRGAMGVVYRAHQRSMDRDVAVKLLRPMAAADAGAVRRFLQEAKTASKLRHPGVVTVFDFGQALDGALYLVMELLEGRPLAAELEEAGAPASIDRVVHIVTQVADAVHHAHEHGLVHRDLKPENVFLLRASGLQRDFVKVLDFGIARTLDAEGGERVTRTGQVCGTPTYMSPEQALGAEVDRRSDVYALGVMTYELLTGRPPFEADTVMRVMRAHVRDDVPAMAAVSSVEVPEAIEAVVRRALAKAPGDRFPTALAFARALADASVAPAASRVPSDLQSRDTAPQGVPDGADLVEPRRRTRRRRLVFGAVAGVIVGALALLAATRGPAPVAAPDAVRTSAVGLAPLATLAPVAALAPAVEPAVAPERVPDRPTEASAPAPASPVAERPAPARPVLTRPVVRPPTKPTPAVGAPPSAPGGVIE